MRTLSAARRSVISRIDKGVAERDSQSARAVGISIDRKIRSLRASLPSTSISNPLPPPSVLSKKPLRIILCLNLLQRLITRETRQRILILGRVVGKQW